MGASALISHLIPALGSITIPGNTGSGVGRDVFFPLRNAPAQDNKRGIREALLLIIVSQVDQRTLEGVSS